MSKVGGRQESLHIFLVSNFEKGSDLSIRLGPFLFSAGERGEAGDKAEPGEEGTSFKGDSLSGGRDRRKRTVMLSFP